MPNLKPCRWRAALGAASIVLALTVSAAPAMAVDVQRSKTYLEQARQHLDRGDQRSALIELLNSLKADPGNVDARLLLADLYLKAGQGIAAQTEIEAARTAGATRDATRVAMANAYILQNQPDKALDELAADQVPAADQAQAHRLRARAYSARREGDKAEAEIAAAEAMAPNDPDIKVDKARLQYGSGAVADAVTTLEGALAINPHLVDGLLFRGELARLSDGLEALLQYFQRAIDAAPTNVAARLERAATLIDLRREEEGLRDIEVVYKQVPEHPLAHYLTAVTKARKGDFSGAQELMNRTKGVLDNYLPAVQFQGLVAYELGELEQAIATLGRVVTATPNNIAARRVYGAALLRNRQPTEAIEQLRPLVDAGGKDTALLAMLGMAYSQTGQHEEAMTFLENAVAQAPDKLQLRTQLAASRLAIGDAKSAARDLQDVLDIEPDSQNALVMLTLVDLRQKDYPSAKANAERITKAFPDLALGYNLLGAAYLGLNELDQAQKYFEASIERDGQYKGARRNLAQLLAARGKPDDARRQYLRVLEIDRTDVQAMVSLADLANQQQRPDDMIDWLTRASAAQPDLFPLRIRLAQALITAGKTDRALTEATAVAEAFGDQPVAHSLLGQLQLASGQADAAADSFRRLRDLTPTDVKSYRLLAGAYRKAGNLDEAIRTLTQALALTAGKAEVLTDLVGTAAAKGDFDVALGYASQLRSEFPDQALGDVAVGDLQMNRKAYAAAASAYEAARAKDFSQLIAVKLQAAYAALGQYDKAEVVLRDWLKKTPDDKAVKVQLATLYLSTNAYKKAADEFEALVEDDSANAVLLNNLAWTYQQLGDGRMVATAERAYDLAPDSGEVLDTLGWILVHERSDVKRGVVLLQQAAQKSPGNPTMAYHLAYALDQVGRPEAAIRELRALLDQHSSFTEREQAVGLLRRLEGR